MSTNIVEVAVFGLGTMGLNLSLNILEKGFKVSAYDIKEEARKNFYNSSGINAYSDVKLLIKDISKPRIIWLMLPSGDCTDSQLNNLKSLLSSGDSIIDGGNSLFLDTIRRQDEFNELGIYFVGLGISGGYAGARNGPSLMVGGEKKAVEIIRPILNAISATANDGSNCVYESVSGAGHLIKTVHNGIEYAIMQLIAESYYVLRNLGKTDCKTISKIFSKWNNTNIGSYLLEITSLILAEDDDFSNQSLIDVIVDSADQNGTGSWSSIAALEFGIYSSIITESVNLRYLSELLDEREILSYRYATNIDPTPNSSNNSLDIMTSDLYASLTNSIICAYAEGFSISILEAMQERLPVIISDGCNFKEVKKSKAGFIVKVEKLEKELTEVFNKIALSKADISKLGKNGAKLIKSGYTISKMSSENYKIYEQFV